MKWEIYFVDSGNIITMTESEARKQFGKDEWKEIKAGYLPHIVATKLQPGVKITTATRAKSGPRWQEGMRWQRR